MKSPFFDDSASSAFCHYRLDAERQLRIEVYEGRVELSDMRSMAQTMVTDPLWHQCQHGLIDLRAAELVLTANEVLRLALMQRQDVFFKRGWLVYVVSESSVYGTVRMLGKWSRTAERSKIFQSFHAAETWLTDHGLDHPPTHTDHRMGPPPAKAAVAPFRKIG